MVEALEAGTDMPPALLADVPAHASLPSTLLARDEFSPTDAHDAGRTLCELIERHAETHPDAPAVRDAARSYSYRELVERSHRLAGLLRERGVRDEVMVALALERSAEFVVAALAVMKAGGTYLAIDLSHPTERLQFLLTDAGVRLHLAESTTVDRLPPIDAGALLVLDRDRALIDAATPLPAAEQPALSSRAYVTYTSGSTGQPKAVETLHAGLSNVLVSMRRLSGIGPGDTFFATANFTFDATSIEVYLPLAAGAATWIAKRTELQDLERFTQELERSRATYLEATPSGWQLLFRMGWKGDRALTMFSMGEALPRALASTMLAHGQRVLNWYGPTETTVLATMSRVQPEGDVTIGRTLDNYAIELRDEQGRVVPRGQVGEIWIGGVGVARGYLNRPELTRERFVDGWYRTGDLGSIRADGELMHLGRRDDQVKIRGHRVELGEIDSLVRKHEGVRDSVTVKRTDERGAEQLVTYFVASPTATPQTDTALSEIWEQEYGSGFTKDEPHIVGGKPVHTGWVSSYTQRRLPDDELAEVFDNCAARILALGPRRIYEVGSGVGLLATRLAVPGVRYRGSDFSKVGVDFLRSVLPADAEVWLGDGNDFSQVAPGDQDMIVINSTMQYFPSVAYCMSVVEQALARVPDGGVLFIGDVRHAGLLETYWRSVLAYRHKGLDPEELDRKVAGALKMERETLFWPEFFHALAARFPEIDRVRVELRKGRANEFNTFRYDVVLHKRSGVREDVAFETLRWEGLDLPALERLLASRGGRGLIVEDVPHGKLPVTRGERASTNPDDFRVLGERLGYTTTVSWSRTDVRAFDVEFAPPADVGVRRPFERPDRLGTLREPEYYARARRDTLHEAELARTLREELARRLPDYMVPAHFVALDQLPLTSTGKVDKGALPSSEAERPQLGVRFTGPRDEAEARVLAIMERHLNVRGIGVHDSFFDLGGNSLAALAIKLDVDREFSTEVPLLEFLTKPNAEHLAQLAQGNHGDFDPASPLIAIYNSGTKTPVFLVAPSGRPHLQVDFGRLLDSDRPVYLLQDPSWTKKHPPFDNLVAQADSYYTHLRRVQPRGPYLLVGYCMGGVLAWHLAGRLKAEGETIELLAMCETPRPISKEPGLLKAIRDNLDMSVGTLPFAFDEVFVKLSSVRANRRGEATRKRTKIRRWVEDQIHSFSKQRSRVAQNLPEDSNLMTTYYPDIDELMELVRLQYKNWRTYEPKPWDGRTLIVRAGKQTGSAKRGYYYNDDVLGWRSLMVQPPEVQVVPGANQYSLGRRPYLFELVRILKDAFAQADARIARRERAS